MKQSSSTSPPVAAEGEAELKLRDHLALVLLDMGGGPLPLYLIAQELAKRGVNHGKGVIVNCLQRHPQRFVRNALGLYSLILNRNGQ